ncbi:Type II/IV secretion system protein TadC, associated with Flp pilus assembly [Georgfuchsia toluolica]|uniref:Type II/IV secretion system protein TadC, associated with Flp pilus assembly n=1 Tax=Georgfuchsia toluolica TaxID=424218 RepID=A0A916J462_9PROT|nr:type II secretion system F family protein [Georgfuchsia toluolica]CAG4882898.1 Type II/IV secretion system protein TadC, associated with Flp pilus assembly [Georgfuchsia toluolica]
MWIYAAIIFLLVTLTSLSLFAWLIPDRSERRLQELVQPANKSNWVKKAVAFAGPLARLSSPEGKWESSPLRIRFINAGIRSANAPIIFYAAKTVLPFVFAGVGYLGLELASVSLSSNTLILVLLIMAMVGLYLPNVALNHAINARRRDIFDNFPDAADLILVCVEAGLGLDAALVRVADEMKIKSGALTEEIHLTNLEIRAGSTRNQALKNLSLRTGVEEISVFASMLSQADKFGTSIGESLRVFSDDLRHKRQIRAEELAAKLPTKMLFPMVLCIFPAISMVILGPAAVQVIRVIMPMLGGQH